MKLISYLGLATAFISFLGIPSIWKTFLFFVIGIVIFVKSYLIYKAGEKPEEKTSFKQNNYTKKASEQEKKEVEEESEIIEDEEIFENEE